MKRRKLFTGVLATWVLAATSGVSRAASSEEDSQNATATATSSQKIIASVRAATRKSFAPLKQYFEAGRNRTHPDLVRQFGTSVIPGDQASATINAAQAAFASFAFSLNRPNGGFISPQDPFAGIDQRLVGYAQKGDINLYAGYLAGISNPTSVIIKAGGFGYDQPPDTLGSLDLPKAPPG